jgi:hypothetical protein
MQPPTHKSQLENVLSFEKEGGSQRGFDQEDALQSVGAAGGQHGSAEHQMR